MVAAIGVPEANWGEAVTALVQLLLGAGVGTGDLAALARRCKVAVQAPKHAKFITRRPRTAVGKFGK